MKSHGICSPLKSSYNKILLFTIYLVGLIISNSPVKSHPSWDTQTTITDFGRNIRQLPCVSRRTGETGVCMFAYSCAKVNGTHLGTCIDRFYFGSCCKTQSGGADVEVNEPDNYLQNNLDNDVAGGPVHVTSNVRPQAAGSTGYPSSTLPPQPQQSYRPTAQFAVSASSASTTPSSTSTSTTSRNQYTEISNSGATRPAYSTAGPVTSAYSTTISQSTKPVPSTTFSTVRPSVKPSPYKPPSPAAQTKPKPQTVRPTVQFSVPSSTSPYNSPSLSSLSSLSSTSSSTSSTSSGHEVTRPTSGPTAAATYSTTTTTSPRPLGSTVTAAATAAFSATKPTVKPSSTTYKSTAAQQSTTTASPQKVKPQTTAAAKPATTRPTPPPPRPSSTPSTSARPEPPSTHESATRTTVEAAVTTAPTAATAAVHHGPSPTTSPGYGGGSSSATTVTSTSPTLVTWTTLDKVPAESSDHTKPPTATYKPIGLVDGSTLPSWVKLPVETHEPNTAGTPPPPSKDSSTSVHSSTSAMPKPTTTSQNPSDNDIIMTSNSISAVGSSTQYPSSTLSMLTTAGTTATPTTAATTSTMDSVEDGSVPLNMSNYKEVCGRRLFPTARIVGGEKVTFGKWPWQISLRQWRTSTYLHKCGAALFNENWAVTAAHCVENVPPSDLLLRLGEHDLSVEEEPYGYEERRIQIVASHPQFDPRTFEYDLALLRFYEPVKFQPNIIPVCVPEDDSNFVSSSAYVTGWGRLYEDGPLPSVLQEVTVPVINNSVCETMYRAAGYIEHIPDIFICAGWKKGGFDSCEGDSGGPMVIQRPDKRWLLAGIISWGIGCAEPNQPGVYTRISKFKDWINQILQF